MMLAGTGMDLSRLRVCCLASNALTHIDALAPCRLLVKVICMQISPATPMWGHGAQLDVHDNHLEAVPGGAFWSGLSTLRVLYLHNNLIADTTGMDHLAHAPRLQVDRYPHNYH